MSKVIHYKLFFYCLITILTTYLMFKFPYSLGGSFVFSGLFIVFSIDIISKKIVVNNFGELLSLIIMALMGINFLAFWENIKRINNIPYLFAIANCTFLMIMFFLTLIERPFKSQKQMNDSEIKILKKIRKTLGLPLFFGSAFSILCGLMIYLVHLDAPNSLKHPLLKISYIVMTFIIFFFFIAYIYFRQISDGEIQKILAYTADRVNDLIKFKKYILIILICLIISGSMIEIQRGMWIMWIETILLINFMVLIIMKVWKNILNGTSQAQLDTTPGDKIVEIDKKGQV